MEFSKNVPQSGDDYWNLLKQTVSNSFKEVFPVSGRVNRLELEAIEFKNDNELHSHDFHSQEKAKHEEKTWGVPVYAKINLVNKETGQIINSSKMKLATLPKMTPRWTFIVDGGEWQVLRQWRLKSGIYGVQKENGDFQAEFNLGKRDPEGNIQPATFAGEGRLAIPFDPESKKFKFKYATTNTPLYSILKLHGVSDEEMKQKWGESIYQANVSKNWEKDIAGFYNKLSRRGVKSPTTNIEDIKQTVLDEFKKAQVLPETTKLTLGHPHTEINKESIFGASNHILSIVRGEKKQDDVYSLEYKNLMGLEDFIREKFGTKKIQNSLRSKMRNVIDKKTRVADIVSSDLFNKQLKRVFVGHTLAQRPDQVNPLDILSNRGITTIFGVGGLQNPQAVRNKMKLISHSHFGFLDSIHSPECLDFKSYVYTKTGWKNVQQITMNDEIACNIDGELQFHKPFKVHKYPYKGKLYGYINHNRMNILVTPNHRMWVSNKNKSLFEFKEMKDIFSKSDQIVTCSHKPYLGNPSISEFKLDIELDNNYMKKLPPVKIDDWLEFLGWYIAEGNSVYQEGKTYKVWIAQSNKVNPEKVNKIKDLLNRIGWNWSYDGKEKFQINSKQLCTYLMQFGKSKDKYLPEYVFECSISARQRLFESLMLGDGEMTRKRTDTKSGTSKSLRYTTISDQLALDIERLGISLGYQVKINLYKSAIKYATDKGYKPWYCIKFYEKKNISLFKKFRVEEDYDDYVYCVSVLGGKILVKREDSAGVWTGNSETTGITLHLPLGVKKIGNEPVTTVYDLKEGKHKYITPAELHSEYTVLPDQIRYNEKGIPEPISHTVTVIDPKTHEFRPLPFKEARYVMPSPKNLFDESTNLIPFLNANQGNRTMTGAKQPTQSIGLKYKEPPLVQVKSNSADSFEKIIGHQFAHRSPLNGTVHDLKKDDLGNYHTIVLKDEKGELHDIPIYNNFPLNDKKSFFHSTPIVKKGEQVKAGQIIGDVNHTVNGVLSMGTNLKVAYTPYYGETFEDGVCISESAAKKLTSEHLHKLSMDIDKDQDHVGLQKFLTYISSSGKKIDKSSFSHLENNGVVKPGTKVKPGDILIAGIRKNELTGELAMIGSRAKGAVTPFKDNSLVWDKEHHGEVVKVVEKPNGKGYTVYVKTEEPAQIGDKLCFDEETEIMTLDGWKKIEEVKLTDQVGIYKNGELKYENPTNIYSYPEGGRMYQIRSQQIDLLVTENHKMFVKKKDKKDFELVEAKDIKEEVYYKKEVEWRGISPENLSLGPNKIISIKDYLILLATNLTKNDKKDCIEYIPKEVFSWAREDLKALFSLIPLSTYPKQILNDLHQLSIHAGIPLNIVGNKLERAEIEPKVEGVFIEDYKRPVYCLTVSSGILMVRRNGKAVLSGNSARHGDKQIIGNIIPDHQMPRVGGPQGEAVDIMINPVSVSGRINIGQLLETAASKIAKKTGKPYLVDNFKPGQDIAEKVRQDLASHGLSDTEKLWDPEQKKYITNPILTGHKYMFKLKHQVEKKLSVRGMDDKTYTVDQGPKSGGGSGAQALGQLEIYALLAHNARENLKEITSYKAERQHDPNMVDTNYWNLIMQGSPLPPPKPTFAYRKFEAFMKGLGLNIVKDGYNYNLQPMTDKGVLDISHGEIKEALAIRGKSDKEINKGIFSEKETGGLPNQPGKGLKFCFASGTLIATDRGYLPIDMIVDLELKVKVLTQNDKEELEWRPIINYWENELENMVELEYEKDGTEIKIICTDDHKFYTNAGQIEAKNLLDKELVSYFND